MAKKKKQEEPPARKRSTYISDLIIELEEFGYKNVFRDFHETEDAIVFVCPSPNIKRQSALRVAVDWKKATTDEFEHDREQLENIVELHKKKNVGEVQWIK